MYIKSERLELIYKEINRMHFDTEMGRERQQALLMADYVHELEAYVSELERKLAKALKEQDQFKEQLMNHTKSM